MAIKITVLNHKFCGRCSFMENERLMALPKRSFKKKFSAWAIDACYDNAKVLLEKFMAEMDQEAISLAQQIVTEATPDKIGGEPPKMVLGGLMPHQQEAITKAWPHVGYAILHRPRCRKTATTIRLASGRFWANQIDKMVVLCPNSIKSVWADEWEKRAMAPHSVHVLDSKKKPAYAKWLKTSGITRDKKLLVLVASIEGMSAGATQDLVSEFIGIDGSRVMMVVDESTRIKNHKSTRTETIWDVGAKCGFRNILTGSEITRTPSDLYAQFRFLGVHTLGFDSFYPFRNRYVVMGGFESKKEVGCKNVEELMAKITQYAHLVKTSDIVNIPEKTFVQRLIDPTPEQKGYIKQLKDEMYAATPAGEEVSVKTAMTAMLRAQQIAGGFFPQVTVDDGGASTTTMIPLKKNPKLDELMDIIYDETGKVVIWARFVAEIQAIRDALAKEYGPESVVTFYGDNSLDERRESRISFQTDEKVRFFVANPTCGSMGLELSAANTMLYYSMDFQYESRVQSLERGTNLDKGVAIGVVDLTLNVKADRAIMEATNQKKDISEWVEDAIHSGQFTIDE